MAVARPWDLLGTSHLWGTQNFFILGGKVLSASCKPTSDPVPSPALSPRHSLSAFLLHMPGDGGTGAFCPSASAVLQLHCSGRSPADTRGPAHGGRSGAAGAVWIGVPGDDIISLGLHDYLRPCDTRWMKSPGGLGTEKARGQTKQPLARMGGGRSSRREEGGLLVPAGAWHSGFGKRVRFPHCVS